MARVPMVAAETAVTAIGAAAGAAAVFTLVSLTATGVPAGPSTAAATIPAGYLAAYRPAAGSCPGWTGRCSPV